MVSSTKKTSNELQAYILALKLIVGAFYKVFKIARPFNF